MSPTTHDALARVAYGAFRARKRLLLGESLFLPKPWDLLSEEDRDAWQQAALAVQEATRFEPPLGDDDGDAA